MLCRIVVLILVYNAIVWQCRRTAEFCDLLKEHGFYEMIRKKTGLIIDSYAVRFPAFFRQQKTFYLNTQPPYCYVRPFVRKCGDVYCIALLAKEHFYLFYLKALLRGAVFVSG